jgi:hypothetical protein
VTKAQVIPSEFSQDFVDKMQARMMMSYYKYGPVKDAYPHKVSALESLRQRLERYEETGNTEWLVDVGNFAMIEFMLPAHKNAHFRATDSQESPGRAAYDTGFEGTAATNRALTDQEWKELRRKK